MSRGAHLAPNGLAAKRARYSNKYCKPNNNMKAIENETINLEEARRNLPIYHGRDRLLEHIKKEDTLIVIGETGSGKTTQIPQYILESTNTVNIIGVTQPRRVAAVTLASRVCQEKNTTLGDLVGYSIRFEDVTSEHTRIKFITDGMLLREAITDPLLLSYNYIILDEAHERTINTDILFGIVKKAQIDRKTNRHCQLKIIVMSATMDVDHFSEYFNSAKVVYIRGREHKVQIFNAKSPQEDYMFSSIKTTYQIHREAPVNEGILVFLTGQEEIESACSQLRTLLRGDGAVLDGGNNIKGCPLSVDRPLLPAKIFSLYSSLPTNLLQLVFRPVPNNQRKIVLATNVAETSITIPGIKHVIDSGKVKTKFYLSGPGLSTLKVCDVSQAQSWQRAGRAGRLGPGTCYRLHTLKQFQQLPTFPQPEILRCNLSSVALQMIAINCDLGTFDFIDKPDKQSIDGALSQLKLLGAIDNNNKLTELGNKMARFPLDPCYSKILLTAKDFSCTEEMVTIIAILSAGDVVFHNPPSKREEARNAHAKFICSCGDHVTFLNVFRQFNKAHQSNVWCHENFILSRNLQYAVNVRKQLLAICKMLDIPMMSCGQNYDSIRKCLISGLFMNVAELHDNKQYVTIGAERQKVSLHPSSVLSSTWPHYVLFSELVHTTKSFIRHVTIVDPDWLMEIAPEFFRQHRIATNYHNNQNNNHSS